MEILSNRVLTMAESETLAMTRIARELRDAGKDVISLSIGEPDFNTPEIIKEFAKQAIDENWTHYPPVPGYPELRKMISHKFKRDNNLEYKPEQIIVSTGAKQSIYQTVMSLVNPGDEVIIPTPFWVSYKEIVKVADGKIVYIPTKIENDFKVSPQELKAAITPKTKLIMFSSPSNPTGMLYTKEELKAIAEVVKDYPHVIIMADEIYEHINFEGKHESIAQFDFIKEQVVTVNGVAKGFAMTGWRVGFIGAPLYIAQACNKLQGQVTSATCSIAQRAVLKAMELDPETSQDIINMRETFRKRRDMMYELLKEIPGFKVTLPQGAFYFFPDISNLYGKHVPKDTVYAKTYQKTVIENSTDMCMYLLYDANVALVQGIAFGDDNCIRLSYATSDDKLKEAARRIKSAILALS
ncbi:MAG TPA: pyridoxal phosphate-dependent aminotransferase [Bacteroidales bacterium]|nr:pyridoxal phosphate-dependent aminotransferase [Bacteroidales bacterium]HOS57275.1 pyridoxal phosphate-dependent aminotransferase [Bacteroidales bacterium]HRR03970.1 pyridoxal phosphate-dependent aminotransferase [Bacteroidales bacterium]HXK74475.1 pyridoxal phosphate-dependent aminotransferase [Bacteroidales bacterium]